MKKYISTLMILFCLHLNAQSNVASAKKEISESVQIMKKRLPLKVDDFTTFIDLNYSIETNVLIFFFFFNKDYLLNYSKTEIEQHFGEIKKSAIKFIINNPNNKAYLIAQLDFKYIYVDSNDNLIYRFTITPNDYN